jgi:hypothetical protein
MPHWALKVMHASFANSALTCNLGLAVLGQVAEDLTLPAHVTRARKTSPVLFLTIHQHSVAKSGFRLDSVELPETAGGEEVCAAVDLGEGDGCAVLREKWVAVDEGTKLECVEGRCPGDGRATCHLVVPAALLVTLTHTHITHGR